MKKKLLYTLVYMGISASILLGCQKKESTMSKSETETSVTNKTETADTSETTDTSETDTETLSEEEPGKLVQASIEYDGEVRTYVYYLPSSYDETKSMPAILSFHGLGSSAEGQRFLTGFDQVAEDNGFIVIYPESTSIDTGDTSEESSSFSWGKQWNAGYENLQYEAGVDDVGFTSALIDKLTEELNLDKKRIYATGASNGAVFTQLLALELSDKIAAVASVIGTMSEPISQNVEPLRPISVLLMMSDTDPVMAFDGLSGTFLSANDTVSYWLNADGITTTPETEYLPQTVKDDTTKIKCDKYTGGKLGTNVTFYTVEGGGHTWPGGLEYASEAEVGKVSYQINASQVIWDYFKDITLPDNSVETK